MDDFLVQFIAQAWRGVALIGGLLLLAFIVARRNAGKKEADIRRQKEAQNPELAEKIANKSNQKSAKKAQAKKAVAMPQAESADELAESNVREDDFIMPSKGSIFDDDDFFPDDDADLVADYPVSEMLTNNEEPVARPVADEEEAVDLASLLAGMVQEDIPQKDYHRIADTPVAVKLVTKNLALVVELLTILRDERDSRLMVQIGDMAYRTLLSEKAAKAIFTDTMRELSGIVLTPDDNPPESVDISRFAPNKMSTNAIDVQVASGGETSAREMISILRDAADGHLIIQIGNTGYRTLADNPKAKAGFSKIMKELSTAITTEDDNPPIVENKPIIASAPKSTQSSSSYFDDEADNKATLPGDIRVASMDDMPDAYKVDRFGRVKVKKVEEKVEEINIAEAIEAYLQYKIQQTPQFKNRGIHIRSAFGGGVRIEVEGKSYEFVDEVAEVDAREFIQQAIAEWQERH